MQHGTRLMRVHISIAIWMIITVISCVASSQTGPARIIVREGFAGSYTGSYGGELSAGSVVHGCPGFVSRQPQFILDVIEEGVIRVEVTTSGDHDPTLMLGGGNLGFCNDDESATSRDPALTNYLAIGEYSLYVGATSSGVVGDYSVLVSHTGRPLAPEVTGSRPLRLQGTSGGNQSATQHGEHCLGAISEEANHTILLSSDAHLGISATSASDLTLVVKSSDGVFCNDDSFGSLDPAIDAWFSEGLVRIYVGSHNPRIRAMYHVTVQPLASE